MRKTIFAILIMAFALSSNAQDDGWMVQIAVYDKQVPASHFNGIKDRVFYSKDALDFHRYFVGKFSEAEADTQKSKLAELGFNASVIHESSFNSQCYCYRTPTPRELTSSLRSIFFDFDKYNLRPASKKQLNLLVKNLRGNPSYSANLRAHTDAKGSNSYNERLSMNRAKAAKNYLIRRGIPASRINIETFGEGDPIARNELDNGSDTEEGRQLNRRVELQVLNASGEAMNLVEDINVPTSLSIQR